MEKANYSSPTLLFEPLDDGAFIVMSAEGNDFDNIIGDSGDF